ncbi:triacylglycerol lipase [uncultured Shewanella sp.]|uniref:esterase/lipase family protein n=1 Tax=Shewanella atlantica TaxID=271099 RepID=UPI002606F91C|nr:lipase [uncultured Shewanella sp.]
MKIVLVHGIFNTGSVLYWMKRQLEAQGYECFTPTIAPLDGRHGIEYASASLKQQIEARFGDKEPISLVGFSMGGIVVRHYLQMLGGAGRTVNFFTLSTPHRGSYWAYLPYPSKGMRQLRPGSKLLRTLDANDASLEGVNVFSYWTPIDFTIVPSSSSFWPVAENKKFFILLHLSVIFSRKIVNEILGQLNQS